MTDFELGLAHYRCMFPDVAAMGDLAGEPPAPAKWKAEYDRVMASGLAATLITASTSLAGSTTAQKNFDQKELLHALFTRRAELDSAFDAVFDPPATKPRRRLGITLTSGCC